MKGGPPTVARTAAPDVRGLRVPERTLPLLRDLIATQAGMHYDDSRLDLLRDRLAPLAIDRGFDSIHEPSLIERTIWIFLKYSGGDGRARIPEAACDEITRGIQQVHDSA